MELVGLEGHHNDDQDDDHHVWHDGTKLIFFFAVTGSVEICQVWRFLDTQVSLAPLSDVGPSVGDNFGFPICQHL